MEETKDTGETGAKKRQQGRALAVSIGVGVAIGAGVGAATGDMGLWLGIGVAIGAGLGSALNARDAGSSQNKHDS